MKNIHINNDDNYATPPELYNELNKEFNNYRQLSCQCNLPKPNSFTGNCTSCNKIIKPIIDKDVNKYTK